MLTTMGSMLPAGGTNYVALVVVIAIAVFAAWALIALVVRISHQGRRVRELEQRFTTTDRTPTPS
jgi:hypothetical protein